MRGLNIVQVANAVWNSVAVANRTVEVNTKTGFSLTAGSYLQHATNNQRGVTSNSGSATTTNATISAVTLARAVCHFGGSSPNTDNVRAHMTVRLTSTTNVQAENVGATSASADRGGWEVEETF